MTQSGGYDKVYNLVYKDIKFVDSQHTFEDNILSPYSRLESDSSMSMLLASLWFLARHLTLKMKMMGFSETVFTVCRVLCQYS
jgi:hypothetical protein